MSRDVGRGSIGKPSTSDEFLSTITLPKAASRTDPMQKLRQAGDCRTSVDSAQGSSIFDEVNYTRSSTILLLIDQRSTQRDLDEQLKEALL